MKRFSLKEKIPAALALMLAAPALAHAQMPWESPLQQLLSSFQGTTARLIITIAIVVSGLAFALGESGGFFRKAAGVVFGAAIAIGASGLASSLFG